TGRIFNLYRETLRPGDPSGSSGIVGGDVSRLALRVDGCRSACIRRTESGSAADLERLEAIVAGSETSGACTAEGKRRPVRKLHRRAGSMGGAGTRISAGIPAIFARRAERTGADFGARSNRRSDRVHPRGR